MYLFELWFSPDICPGLGLLNHMASLQLVFKETSIEFSTVGVLSYIHSPAFIVRRFFDGGYSDWCEMIPHCISAFL